MVVRGLVEGTMPYAHRSGAVGFGSGRGTQRKGVPRLLKQATIRVAFPCSGAPLASARCAGAGVAGAGGQGTTRAAG